ncbi:hypothetical protein [Ideonella sp. BN130291]|uniref:hypothetical protein n=1 Tax=Ideonella sp. BN130291 TaxID=3112940 RepID=UPI002E274945|nr:hypothetical protein [Ideonella sp. BN130291]
MANTHHRIPLTPRIERVLALDGPPFGRPRPTPDELEGIRQVLAEGAPAARRLNLAFAMAIVADNAPDDRSAQLVAAILHDPAADAALRRQAAAVLGDIPVPRSSTALAQALRGSPPALEASLLKSLAKVGDGEAARAIAALGEAATPQLTQLRGFARGAILYRIGGAVDQDAERALLPAGERVAFTSVPSEEVQETLRRFRGSTYGLRFNPALAYAFQCGHARHLVLLSAELQRGRLLAALAEKRRLLGIVAMQDERGSPDYLARRLIVARPAGATIHLSVLSPSGEVDMTGSLRHTDHGMALSLRSHGARRPVQVEGSVSDDGIALEATAFSEGPWNKRTGDTDPAAA